MSSSSPPPSLISRDSSATKAASAWRLKAMTSKALSAPNSFRFVSPTLPPPLALSVRRLPLRPPLAAPIVRASSLRSPRSVPPCSKPVLDALLVGIPFASGICARIAIAVSSPLFSLQVRRESPSLAPRCHLRLFRLRRSVSTFSPPKIDFARLAVARRFSPPRRKAQQRGAVCAPQSSALTVKVRLTSASSRHAPLRFAPLRVRLMRKPLGGLSITTPSDLCPKETNTWMYPPEN